MSRSKASRAVNQKWREKRTTDLKEVLEYTGYRHKWFTPYHVRIYVGERTFDFFPTNGKYHDLEETTWGKYDKIVDIYKIIGG